MSEKNDGFEVGTMHNAVTGQWRAYLELPTGHVIEGLVVATEEEAKVNMEKMRLCLFEFCQERGIALQTGPVEYADGREVTPSPDQQ